MATIGSGETHLGATAILATGSGGQTCLGTSPQSDGYNAVSDGACSLGEPTDDEAFGLVDPVAIFPAEDSALVDTVPLGVLGCGTVVTTDGRGQPGIRPFDGDSDSVSACDTGAYERTTSPPE